MPSYLHDALIRLFQNRPRLAADVLLHSLQVTIPAYESVRIDSADLTDIEPAEYRADLVIVLSAKKKPVQGIVVEVQRSRDDEKCFAWPAYAVNLRARLRCPVCLLVVAVTDAVAKWAARPLEIGGGNCFTPLVLGRAGVPQVTDLAQAHADPELAVLSVIAHAKRAETSTSVRIARAALLASEDLSGEKRSSFYIDFIMSRLNENTLEALRKMESMASFMRRYVPRSSLGRYCHAKGITEGVAKGIAEGIKRGQVSLVIRLLEKRFGSLPPRLRSRVESASLSELESMVDRFLTAATVEDVLGPHKPRKRAAAKRR